MINIPQELKAGIESGDLRANFRLCKTDEGYEIAIYRSLDWETGVFGERSMCQAQICLRLKLGSSFLARFLANSIASASDEAVIILTTESSFVGLSRSIAISSTTYSLVIGMTPKKAYLGNDLLPA